MKLLTRLKSFTAECIRVIKVTKKPSKEEFQVIVKVSGIGMIVIGMIGFIIQLIEQLLL